MGSSIDRRTFLKGLAGAGALIATSQLPASAWDDPKAFAGRGKFERLAISYATVKLGLEHPFSVLHISDVHLASAYPYEKDTKLTLQRRRVETFGGRQEEALQDCLAWAKKNTDYVVLTGDLIDWQSEANFDLVKKYFGDNFIASMGNHEFSQDMWLGEIKETKDEAYKDLSRHKLGLVYPFDIQFCSQVVNGVNFITLDDVYGYVVQSQVDRFMEEVKKGLPIVLCMHVPFYTEDIWRNTCRFWNHADTKFTDGSLPEPSGDYLAQINDPVTRDFIAYLKTEPLLKAILAGHEHFTMEERFSPTAVQYLVGGAFMFQGREVLFI